MKLNNVLIVSSVATLALGVAYASPQLITKADTDQDGFVSLSEFKALKAERIEKHFQRIDANEDGLLSEQEIEAASEAHKHRAKRKRHHNPERLVERLDEDNSGGVSLAEFEGRRFAPGSDAFYTADIDGNGELDAGELKAFMEERKAMHRRNRNDDTSK